MIMMKLSVNCMGFSMKILLIDDDLVGGSTTNKCTELLLENGANEILIMCLGEYSSYD